MLDKYAISLIKPVIDKLARQLVRVGLRADHITLAGFAIGLVAAVLIAARAYSAGDRKSVV